MSDAEQASETELSPQRVAELRDAGEADLIDVREDYEFDAGHISGARNIEINRLTAQTDSIPRDRAVIFCCRSGNRSGMAAQAFREAGWDAYNVAGGVLAWVEGGLEIEPEGGSIAERHPPEA